MIHRAVRCMCGHSSCKDWHVSPVADVQGVKFTEGQAKFIAEILNAVEVVQQDVKKMIGMT